MIRQGNLNELRIRKEECEGGRMKCDALLSVTPWGGNWVGQIKGNSDMDFLTFIFRQQFPITKAKIYEIC
jgi:hypothetical protein